jgi:hypothetical protein
VNRPGLPSIRYRVGTFATFHEAMVEAAARRPELQLWTSRASDDFGMAMLAMWAWIGDVLTFYQERVANEAFVRTALLPESVRRLAALLGYEPAPGAAAVADLAFTLDDGRRVVLPRGLQVQSVPGEGERPQPFETSDAVHADARLNEVRVGPAPIPRPAGALAGGSERGFLLDPVEVSAGDQVWCGAPPGIRGQACRGRGEGPHRHRAGRRPTAPAHLVPAGARCERWAGDAPVDAEVPAVRPRRSQQLSRLRPPPHRRGNQAASPMAHRRSRRCTSTPSWKASSPA